jgi:hypothetical protein
VIVADFDPDTWGTAAEWATGLGTAVALILTYLLLRHEIRARKAAEANEAKKRQDDIARRQLSELRIMLADQSSDAVAPAKCAELARRIELDRFEISNDELRDRRLYILRQVAFTMGMSEEAFNRSASTTRPTTRAAAVNRFRVLLSSVALSLEHYITGKQLPPWPESLPDHPGRAQAWIWMAPK